MGSPGLGWSLREALSAGAETGELGSGVGGRVLLEGIQGKGVGCCQVVHPVQGGSSGTWVHFIRRASQLFFSTEFSGREGILLAAYRVQ